MYLIAINKIIKCFLFLFLYSFLSYCGFFRYLIFFYFPVFNIFFFHSHCIFFCFLLLFFLLKFIFLCPYFFLFALCFFSSICHSKFFYKLPFSHYRLFVLQARKQEYPFSSSSSSHPVVLLPLSHFTVFSSAFSVIPTIVYSVRILSSPGLKIPSPCNHSHPNASYYACSLCITKMYVSYMQVLYIHLNSICFTYWTYVRSYIDS